MARIPQVTRTITTTHATVLCLNLDTKQSETKEVVVPRTYKTDADVLKAVKRSVDTDSMKAVHIVNTEVVETLYGMTEEEFIAHAAPLPARGTKADTDNEADTETENK